MLFVIWKEINGRIFTQRASLLQSLTEKVKVQTFWWLKSYYHLFEFDYLTWRFDRLLWFKDSFLILCLLVYLHSFVLECKHLGWLSLPDTSCARGVLLVY